jgi:hypothetical protein
MFMCTAGQARPRFGNGLHHQSGLGDAKTGAAIRLRDADAEPSVIGKGAVEVLREAAVVVLGEPVVVAKARADLLDRCADRLLLGREREIHQRARAPAPGRLANGGPPLRS